MELWVERKTTAKIRDNMRTLGEEEMSACASYRWKVLSSFLLQIKDTALVLSQRDATFTVVMNHPIRISLLLFLCKCIFLLSTFSRPNETAALMAALPSLVAYRKITRYALQHFWEDTSDLDEITRGAAFSSRWLINI